MRTRRKNKNRGFTLVELIVSMALAAILFTAALTLLAPLYRENRRIHENADAQQLAGSLLDEMRALAEGSNRVYAATTAGSGEVHVGLSAYTVSDGRLLLDGTPVFSAAYYGDQTIQMQCAGVSTNLIETTITVSDGTREICTVKGLVGSLRRVLDAGNGLLFSDPAPDQGLRDALASLSSIGSRIDSTAPVTNTGGSPTNVGRILNYLAANGIDFAAANLRSWAIVKEGGIYVMWWTDQDINAYADGDWVRAIRYNPNYSTYTPGYVILQERMESNLSGKYITIRGGGASSAVWVDGGLAAADKKSYQKAVDYFNTMAVVRP